jgi:FkbM family methyltransferase
MSLIRKIHGMLHMKYYGKLFFGPRTIVTKVEGISYELDLGQLIDASLFFFGCFEKNTTECLKTLVQPGMTVLDIGANIGCHVLPMARRVGDKGRVIAFEPMNWARKKLVKNIGLNDFTNIVVENSALSDRNGSESIRFRSNWPLDNAHQPEACIEQMIQFVKLDDYIEANQLAVDLIKLDVDGFEFKVFRGAERLLKSQKPVILTELGHTTDRVGDSLAEMVRFLDNLGYLFFDEKDFSLIETPLDAVRAYLEKDKNTINVLLIHSDERNEVLSEIQ